MAEKERANRVERQTMQGCGTGIDDVFNIISLAPPERLRSLTLKNSSSLAEELVNVMCLIHLRKGSEALAKLQTHKDNNIANYLAKMVTTCGDRLDNVKMNSFKLPESRVDTLRDLAKIFTVLAQERLCDESLRDQAYTAALVKCMHNKTAKEDDVWHTYLECLKEEVKTVCGHQIIEQVLSLCEGSSNMPKTLIGVPGMSDGHSIPSSLRSSDFSTVSYPSRLEISAPSTAPGQPSPQINPENSYSETELPMLNLSHIVEEKIGSLSLTASCRTPAPLPPQSTDKPPSTKTKSVPCADSEGSNQLVTSKSHDEEAKLYPIFSPVTTYPSYSKDEVQPVGAASPSHQVKTQECSGRDEQKAEDEEDVFYSFVIMHAPEDLDEAERLRVRLEAMKIGDGAISQDFFVPGSSTLKCVENAIDNSAFTILLLSRNFSSRLYKIEANSALINSIEYSHKYNSVIPLLPRENGLPRGDIPKVLRTIVALDERSKAFERGAKKAMSPEKIATQKKIWSQEQRIRRQRKRQRRLEEENRRNEELIHENERLRRSRVEQERVQRLLQQPNGPWPGPPQASYTTMPSDWPRAIPPQPSEWWHPQPNISIQNARYIMIGNDSTMTVGIGGEDTGDED